MDQTNTTPVPLPAAKVSTIITPGTTASTMDTLPTLTMDLTTVSITDTILTLTQVRRKYLKKKLIQIPVPGAVGNVAIPNGVGGIGTGAIPVGGVGNGATLVGGTLYQHKQ